MTIRHSATGYGSARPASTSSPRRRQDKHPGDRGQAQTRVLVRLNELSSLLWRTRSLREGLEAALSSAIDLVGAEGGYILLSDTQWESRSILAQQGFGEAIPDIADGPLLGQPHNLTERILIEDVEAGMDFAELRSIARSCGFRSLQCTPLIGRDGDLAGIISTHWHAVHRPGEIELLALDLHARQICDFLERCRADEALRENETAPRRLAAIVESSDDAIVSKDLDGTIMSWNAGAEKLFGYSEEEAIGQSIAMLIPPDRQDEEPHILDRIRRGEKIKHYETVRRRKDGELVDISLTVSPMKDASGRVVGASKIAHDISERRLAEKHCDLLVAELSHRVKNTLATVMSVARHSFRQGITIDEARASFEKRLQALANNHSRLALARWSGVALNDIFDDELFPYGNGSGDNICLSGPPVSVKTRYAPALGMAVHELATNAAKYGALSAGGGTVTVEWKVDPDRDQLRIHWTEAGGPPARPPKKRGFGCLLLERALAADLGGEVVMDFAETGLKCTMGIPLDGCVFEAETAATGDASGTGSQAGLAAAAQEDRAQRQILVVEDEYLLASALTYDLTSAGYAVVGPFTSLKPARAGSHRDGIDLAILDVNLGEETVYPLADELVERKLPFILLTGFGAEELPERFRRLPRVTKPYDTTGMLSAIDRAIASPAERSSGADAPPPAG